MRLQVSSEPASLSQSPGTILNHPSTSASGNLGWGEGIFAPGRSSDRSRSKEGNSATEPYIVAHNVLKAHAAAVGVYRQEFQVRGPNSDSFEY